MNRPPFNVVRKFAIAIVLTTVIVLGCVAARIVNYARKTDTGRSDAAIVLGAAVDNGIPTHVFEQRIRHAIELYERGTVDRLILTGGVGAGDKISEAEAAREYCLARGWQTRLWLSIVRRINRGKPAQRSPTVATHGLVVLIVRRVTSDVRLRSRETLGSMRIHHQRQRHVTQGSEAKLTFLTGKPTS